MDDNPEIRDRLNVNKSTYHNKRPRERFICFIRGAKWTKINHLNGPSPIHDTSTWLSQSIQSIRHVCCRLGMQKNLLWKCFRTAFGHYDFPSTSASQQVWRMRKRYHLLLVALASHWLLKLFFLKSNDVLDAVLGTDLGEQRCFKFLIRQFVSLNKTKIICSMTDRKPFVACRFCGVKISSVIGCNTMNIPDIF